MSYENYSFAFQIVADGPHRLQETAEYGSHVDKLDMRVVTARPVQYGVSVAAVDASMWTMDAQPTTAAVSVAYSKG